MDLIYRHDDITGNCVADEPDRTDTTEKEGIYSLLPTCKYLIAKHIINIAESRWNQSLTCSTSRQTRQDNIYMQ